MCIDRQDLGSEGESVIEIEHYDGNFEDPQMGSNGWYTQYRGI